MKKPSFRNSGLKTKGPSEFLEKALETERAPHLGMESRAEIELSAKALLNNYQAIQAQVPDQALLPMIKANAYGHGGTWAAKLLSQQPELYGLGTATLHEAREVRQALGAKQRRTPIIVFSETSPWSDEKGRYCEQHGLTPVIATDADWNLFLKGKWAGKIPYELMFNTGMNRLGISTALLKQVATALKNRPPEARPTGVFSHLAMAETPDSRLTHQQMELFVVIRKELGSTLPGTQFHLANSAGIWNQKLLGLSGLTDAVRPGLSLYGVPPWPQAPERGLLPVMTFRAQVIAIHRLKAGDSIGYGGTFKVSGNEPVFAAILAAGYADGVKRSLSSQGHAWLGGRPTRFLGTVSMDLCAVEATAQTRVGEWAELIGPHVDPWAQAKAAGTIPYELLTSMLSFGAGTEGARVRRIYEDQS